MKVFKLIAGFILLIPAIAFLMIVVFVCIACSTPGMERYTSEIDEMARRRVIARSRTPAAVAAGLDEARIKSCSELIVLEMNENGGNLTGQCDKYSCSICLEEYGAKETVRRIKLCLHTFHADCVDNWFQKNSTCPICRLSLLDEKL